MISDTYRAFDRYFGGLRGALNAAHCTNYNNKSCGRACLEILRSDVSVSFPVNMFLISTGRTITFHRENIKSQLYQSKTAWWQHLVNTLTVSRTGGFDRSGTGEAQRVSGARDRH